jgi:hypothetical protein
MWNTLCGAAVINIIVIKVCTLCGFTKNDSFMKSYISSIEKGDTKMSQYVIVYLGGDQPSNPEQGKQHMAKYMEWLASLGNAAVSPANPLKNTTTVNPDGTVSSGGTTTMSGYTIIEAESLEAALEIAKACPFLDTNGSLEVSELMQMPG